MGFIPIYNLEAMNEGQRQQYIKDVCAHLQVPDNLNLVMLGFVDEEDGPRRMVAYVKRGATEIIRDKRGISTKIIDTKVVNGSFVVTAVGRDDKGREETALGAKWIQDLSGKALDDAIMTAQTRAHRRATLQFLGAGVLDESEVQHKDQQLLKNETPIALPPVPSAQVNNQVGADITPSPAWMDPALSKEQSQEAFEKGQADLRAEAIAKLNAKTAPATSVEKKTRKPRTKKSVDIGDAPIQPNPPGIVETVINHEENTIAHTRPLPPETPAPPAPPATTPVGPPPTARLTPEQVKPFRQRQFQFVTELEHHGFAPKENLGNLDKMRSFVGLLFPTVTNFNELSMVQWEQYLNTLETKLKKEGPAATIKYIEDAIGV